MALGAIASIGGSIAGAVGARQSQQAQADAQNAAAISNYQHQIRRREYGWRQTLNVWHQKRNEYDFQIQKNNRSLNLAYADEQAKFNEILDKAAFDNQNMLIKRMKASGRMAAAARNTGVSATRMQNMPYAEWGYQQAATAASLASAGRSSLNTMGKMRDQAFYDNYNAWTKVAIAPEPDLPPPPPTMMPGPSGMGIAAAALGGIGNMMGRMQSMAPPGGGGFANYSQMGGGFGGGYNYQGGAFSSGFAPQNYSMFGGNSTNFNTGLNLGQY